MTEQIFLSSPDVGAAERDALVAALDSGWVTPIGPDLSALEEELAAFAGTRFGVALASSTAALHLALVTLGVGPGDEVVVSTLTFVASANAVSYVGGAPAARRCRRSDVADGPRPARRGPRHGGRIR
jgi:pyridoxal phosphate-dependent aminotransferase EpsN